MSHRRLAGSAVVALVGLFLLVVPLPAARAATVAASAWWYRPATTTPTAEVPQPVPGGDPVLPVTAPGPPSVADGELHVEGTPEGATAIAALTFELDEDESSPVLTITPTSSSVIPPDAVILACRAAVGWVAPKESPGAWETKPLVDCTRSVQAQPGAAGALVFPLQPLAQGTLLDVVIVPGTVAGRPAEADGSTFSLTFPKPGPAALTTTRDSSSPAADFASEPDPVPLPDPITDFGVSQSFEPSLLDPVADAPVAPALEPQEQAPSVPRVVAPAASVLPDRGAARTLGLVLLLLGGLGAYLAANQAPRTAIGLGRFRRLVPSGAAAFAERHLAAAGAAPAAEPVDRGLGRLRRPRLGSPPSL